MQNENNIHTLIIRLFAGEASPDEKLIVGDWLNQSANNEKLYNDLKEIWLTTGTDSNADNYNIKKAIAQFQSKIKIRENKFSRIIFSDVLKYAAIVVLLIALPIFYFVGRNSIRNNDTFTTITCAFGDKSAVTLPDGSRVWLNSGSKLTFKNNFYDDYRFVKLEGEAYFSVKHNEKIPFKVEASDISIQVFGTEFNVKAYPDENTISTTLVKGSVEIESSTQKTLLKPYQKIIYNRNTKKMTRYQLSDVAFDTEWKDGRLVFRNESLAELELKLERWFDVDIDFADDEVKTRHFSGVLERESILEALSYFNCSKYVGYKINGNQITFYSKK